jgi:uncharacterized protein (DUF427 family)
MGLMSGSGPLGRAPAGRFNFEPPAPGKALYLEPTPKRIRIVVGGETIADSRAAMILHESGHQPVYYFPASDVRLSEFFVASDRHTRCPKKGEACYWTIRAGGVEVEAGAWYYPDPIPAAPPALRDAIAFYWNRMDHWYEEDEEVFVHPRDPYHRVDLCASSRRVRITMDGTELAVTDRALALFESNLPTRWYIPREDVLADLEPSDTVTRCPYKGTASYYSVGVEEAGKDLVWYYEPPLPEVGRIAGLLCFFNERVDLELDGVLAERPVSPWSTGVKSDPAAQNASPAETRG